MLELAAPAVPIVLTAGRDPSLGRPFDGDGAGDGEILVLREDLRDDGLAGQRPLNEDNAFSCPGDSRSVA